MEIKSLIDQIKYKQGDVLADLFTSCFIYDPTVELNEYTIKRHEEMRIDMIMSSLYQFDPSEADMYISDIDIILYINGIDNGLNLIEGMVIKYPDYPDLSKFRLENTDNDFNDRGDVTKTLSFPNKSTRKDKNREEFTKNGYSLPPVVLETPRDPVQIKDGKFIIGGL